jgi:hypothetical protein
MVRSALALGLLALAADPVAADISVPPPKGKKFVQVEHAVVLGKGATGYVFVRTTADLASKPESARLELKEGTAVPVQASSDLVVHLYAVPENVAKEYKTDEELFAAVRKGTVKGTHYHQLPPRDVVPVSVKAATVKWTTTITAIDPKRGFVTKVIVENAPKEKRPQASAGPVAAGVLAALALALGGAWFVGRARRKSV